MTKSLMISIHKKHIDNIKNKLKTLELRTWLPKLNGLKGIWVYIYESLKNGGIGAVIGRFWFDEYEEITLSEDLEIITSEISHELLLQKSCIGYNYLNNYFMNQNGDVFGYAWHIKQLEVFDEPKELSEFIIYKEYLEKDRKSGLYKGYMYADDNGFAYRLKNPPQKSVWIYV